MAGANLRYLALRRRIAGLLADEPHAGVTLVALVGELYRGLPHYRVIGFFRVVDDMLELVAGRGADLAAAAGGLARAAQETASLVFVPDIRRDERARPADEGVVGEIAVPVLQLGEVVGVIDVQSDRLGSLGPGDRDLLQWLAGELGSRFRAEIGSR